MALDWDLVSAPSESLGRAVCWSPDLLRYAALGTIPMYSDDGVIWNTGVATDYTANTNFVNKNGIIWNVNLQLFIAVCSDNTLFTTVLTSPDGITWTTRTIDIVLAKGIGYEPVTGITVIVGSNGACTQSPDGITWSSAGIDLVGVDATADWKHILWIPAVSQFVAVADVGNVRIATSPDGTTWTGRHGFEPNYLRTWTRLAVKAGDDVVVCCAGVNGSRFMKSEDGGTTWETPYLIPGLPVFSVEAYIVIWSEILDTFILVVDNDTDLEGQVWLNPTGDELDWTQDSLIPDTVVSSGSAWEWQALAEAVDINQFVAGQENPSDQPWATSVEGATIITGDIQLAIEDISILASPNEMIGDIALEIMVLDPHEIIGDIALVIGIVPTTVWSADASGLYVLVPGKTDDTIYAREHTEETQDVAIPDPVLGTAYIGG